VFLFRRRSPEWNCRFCCSEKCQFCYEFALDPHQPIRVIKMVSVRYIVHDVDEAIAFYTGSLGFRIEIHPAPGFAALVKDGLHLLLNRPGAGGAGQSMTDGSAPSPGGWNRIQIEVDDLSRTVDDLTAKGHAFRGEIVQGNGGKQALVNDPGGNPVELFEPVRRSG
jgi:catechol 2,3-dioxygenase-like lactoylglutathione lyase family enzyme